MAAERITIEQIARACGVSLATVSLVLNNNPRISAKTRQRIWQKIHQLNYQPNWWARSLARKNSHLIATVLPPLENIFSDTFFANALEGIFSVLRPRHYELVLKIATNEVEPQIAEYRRLLSSRFISGLIFLGGEVSEYKFLKEIGRDFPVLLVGGYLPGNSVSSVSGDNRNGGYLATRYLLDLGHRRIAMIYGNQKVLSAAERYQGYLQALKEAGVKPDKNWLVDGYFREMEGFLAMKKLLMLPAAIRPSAVFAGNDMMALGALAAIKQAGLSVPKDISLVGMDNIYQTEICDPPLTTIHYPVYAFGAYAAQKLVDFLEGRTREFLPFHKTFGVKLIIRQSCRKIK